MRRSVRTVLPAIVAGLIAVLVPAPLRGASPGPGAPSSAISGILRADGAPLAGVSLVVRGITGAATSVVKVLKTDAEGTFCLADAAPGVYSILAAVPGFKSASAQVLHGTTPDGLSFVRLDLDRERRGVLPAGPGGALDPWTARVVLSGDVLREQGPVEVPSPSEPAPLASTVATANAVPLPVQGSVASLQGFAAEGGGARSQTSLDVRGSLGGGAKWGLSGEYDRVTASGGRRLGGASRVALDVLPSDGHSIRVSSNRSELPSFDSPDARLDAHTVDWAASPGKGSRASVTARILSHRNLEPAALPSALFRSEGSALEVDASYRSDLGRGHFVRVHAGYRSDTAEGPGTGSLQPDRQGRIGGTAGIRLLDALLLEAGGTGDYSAASRGVTPEVTLSVETPTGLTVYGFASRRFEQTVQGVPTFGIVGIDPADLVRATQALYRAGARLDGQAAGRVELEASRREISEAFQLLLDTEVVDRVDALYLFPGDRADEVSGTFTFAVKADVAARLALLGGLVRGDGTTAGSPRNEARYWVSSARVEVRPSGTSVTVRYRLLDQDLGAAASIYRYGRRSVDVTLAQAIPIPILRDLGSRWQALFSLEMGNRSEGDAESRQNRQMAGGLSLSF